MKPNLSPEDLIKELKKIGIDPDRWVNVEEKMVKPIALEQQTKLLVQLKGMFEGIVEQDRKKVLSLKEQVERLKHGGGV